MLSKVYRNELSQNGNCSTRNSYDLSTNPTFATISHSFPNNNTSVSELIPSGQHKQFTKDILVIYAALVSCGLFVGILMIIAACYVHNVYCSSKEKDDSISEIPNESNFPNPYHTQPKEIGSSAPLLPMTKDNLYASFQNSTEQQNPDNTEPKQVGSFTPRPPIKNCNLVPSHHYESIKFQIIPKHIHSDNTCPKQVL